MAELSPQAQAVLDAAIRAAESPDAEAIASAVLRAAANHIPDHQMSAHMLYAIANELENHQ